MYYHYILTSSPTRCGEHNYFLYQPDGMLVLLLVHLLLIWHLQLHFSLVCFLDNIASHQQKPYTHHTYTWKLYVQHQYLVTTHVHYCPPSWYILCTLCNHIKVSKFNKLSSCFVSLHSCKCHFLSNQGDTFYSFFLWRYLLC